MGPIRNARWEPKGTEGYVIVSNRHIIINYVEINIIQQNIFLLKRVGRTFFGTSGSQILMNGNSGLAYFNVGNTPPPSLMVVGKKISFIVHFYILETHRL